MLAKTKGGLQEEEEAFLAYSSRLALPKDLPSVKGLKVQRLAGRL